MDDQEIDLDEIREEPRGRSVWEDETSIDRIDDDDPLWDDDLFFCDTCRDTGCELCDNFYVYGDLT